MSTKFRAGDRFKVTLEGVIIATRPGTTEVQFDNYKFANGFCTTDIEKHFTLIHKPLAVGDSVVVTGPVSVGKLTILAIDGGYAWLLGDGWRPVVQLSDLTRA